MNKTFCRLLWRHVAVSTSGTFRPCCNISYIREDYKDGGEFPLHYIYKEDIEDVWNSDTYKNFRLKMLAGEKQPSCNRCYREEEVGIKSARMTNNETFDMVEINEDGTCPLDTITYVDVRLGNKCNLKCRMCNPFASDQWIEDERKTGLRKTPIKTLDKLGSIDWFNKDKFWNNLSKVIDNCTLLYFSGGEPALFLEQQYKLFDECIEKGIAKNMVLRYNTNMTILPPQLIEYFKHFKQARINCSIDGIGKVNKYIRYPTKWSVVEKNLRLLTDLSKDHNIKVSVHSTIQMYNIFNLVDLFEYLKQYNMFPFLNILHHPIYYTIKTLYPDQKEKVTKMLTDWYENNKQLLNEYDSDNHHSKLLGVIEYMNGEDLSHMYDDFLHEAHALDEVRSERLKDYVPELER